MCARPVGAKSLTVLALIDGQIYIEAAIDAAQRRDWGAVERALQLALWSHRQAAGQIEGMKG
jgi:hypothetical protein